METMSGRRLLCAFGSVWFGSLTKPADMGSRNAPFPRLNIPVAFPHDTDRNVLLRTKSLFKVGSEVREQCKEGLPRRARDAHSIRSIQTQSKRRNLPDSGRTGRNLSPFWASGPPVWSATAARNSG